MKTKTVLLVFTVLLGVGCIWFLSSVNGTRREQTWAGLVSQQIQSLQKLNDRPAQSFSKDVKIYLRDLGLSSGHGGNSNDAGSFDDDVSVLSKSEAVNVMPTVVTVAVRGSGPSVYQFVRSVLHHWAWLSIVVYDLGLSAKERKLLLPVCNSSKCSVQEFDWSKYPGHLRKLEYGAYRPIIIQEMLNTTGAVLFATPEHRVVSDNGLEELLNVARQKGIAGWALNDSTSAVTHPKMFTFYDTVPQNYYFHRAISGDPLIVYNLVSVHRSLMLPWVQCALTEACLRPLGVDPAGCRRPRYRRPLYLYSGCHRYDTSILNVVLGLLFHYDSSPYTVSLQLGSILTKPGS